MRLTVLAGSGRSTDILLNWLHDQGFDDIQVIIENEIPRRAKLRTRFRRLGFWTVFGQLVFQVTVPSVLKLFSTKRIYDIMDMHSLRDDVPAGTNVIRVDSVNDEQTTELLQRWQPNLVLVNGTRIIRRNVLGSIESPFVNIHAGITPLYRGVHGGYWALWNKDTSHFGSTIHLIDEGVDTGGIIAHIHEIPSLKDNFVTYPLLQQAVSLSALREVLSDENLSWLDRINFEKEKIEIGRQWYHPTIWQYFAGAVRGIK